MKKTKFKKKKIVLGFGDCTSTCTDSPVVVQQPALPVWPSPCQPQPPATPPLASTVHRPIDHRPADPCWPLPWQLPHRNSPPPSVPLTTSIQLENHHIHPARPPPPLPSSHLLLASPPSSLFWGGVDFLVLSFTSGVVFWKTNRHWKSDSELDVLELDFFSESFVWLYFFPVKVRLLFCTFGAVECANGLRFLKTNSRWKALSMLYSNLWYCFLEFSSSTCDISLNFYSYALLPSH